MNITWFPGHMARTMKLIREKLPLTDLVIEVCDARIPVSSRNPEIKNLVDGKKQILLLCKSDLADPEKTEKSIEALQKLGIPCMPFCRGKNSDVLSLKVLIEKLCSETLEQHSSKGRRRKLRCMVAGIPNSGKSSLINRLAKGKKTQVENRPGVTRSAQWVKTDLGFDLLDMPGMLWPNLKTEEVKLNLALCGAIKDEILPLEELAFKAANELYELYPEEMSARFGKFCIRESCVEAGDGLSGDFSERLHFFRERFEQMALNRSCVKKGGKADLERFSRLLINEFRSGKIGRLSLETLTL